MRKFTQNDIAWLRAKEIALRCYESVSIPLPTGWAYDTSGTTWCTQDRKTRLEYNCSYVYVHVPYDIVGVLCGSPETSARVIIVRHTNGLRALAVGVCDDVVELYSMEGFDCDRFLKDYTEI